MYDADDHYAVYPYIDIDYPRNDDEEEAHIVWTHCTTADSTNDPTVLYWNTDMWNGIYPNPCADLDGGGEVDEGLGVLSLYCGDGLESGMVAYVRNDGGEFQIYRADLDYTTSSSPDIDGAVVVSDNQTYRGFIYNTWGPAIATHDNWDEDHVMHIFWGDKGANGTGTPQIMEDYTDH